MENQIIINMKIAEGFQELMQNNYIIKQALIPAKTKHGRFNRVIIKTVFSMLKAMDDLCFKSDPHLYEEHINRILFLISKKYQLYHVKSAVDENLGIDLNSCIERNDIITNIICEKFTKSIEFYRLIQDEIVNFYNKENKQCYKAASTPKSNENTQKPFPGPEYFKPMFTQQQITEQQFPICYKAYDKPMFSTGNPYANPRDFGEFRSVFNQEQTRAINDIYVKIPSFGPNGKPMNKAAEELAKVIDRRIAEYEKTKARNHRKMR